MTTTPSDISRLTPEEIDASLAIILEVFRQFRPVVLARAGKSDYTDKADGSPLTDTDVEIEKALQKALMDRFPQVPVYGEETGYSDDLPDACWLVDPIDGTKSFVQNLPGFTGMAVLIQGDEAVASLIYNTSTDDVYIAQKDQGAYKNGVRIDLRRVPLAKRAVAKGGPITVTVDAILKSTGVTCEPGLPGGGWGFTMVLDGVMAARFNLQGGGYVHDYAPGALLVREAGGALVPIQDDVYNYTSRSFVACHPDLEVLLRQHVQELRDLETVG